MLLTTIGSTHAGIGKTAFVSYFLWRCLSDVHFNGIERFVLDTHAGIYMVDRSSDTPVVTGGDHTDWRATIKRSLRDQLLNTTTLYVHDAAGQGEPISCSASTLLASSPDPQVYKQVRLLISCRAIWHGMHVMWQMNM